MNEQQILEFYMENDMLISPELLLELKARDMPLKSEFSVINNDVLDIIRSKVPVDVNDFEKAIVLKEKYKNTKMYDKFLEYIHAKDGKTAVASNGVSQETTQENNDFVDNLLEKTPEMISQGLTEKTAQLSPQGIVEYRRSLLEKSRIRLVMDYSEKSRKRSVGDFVNYFNSRYKELERILRSRQELQNLTSIARINGKREKENVALIGVVYEKSTTKNNNIMLTLEDPTGTIKAVIRQNKEELFKMAQEIQLDEVIGVTGTFDGLIFVNSLFIPDIPLTKELKKSPEEGYFVVIADPQIGSKLFLEKEFKKFIGWMNREVGSDTQKDIASKVKYLFIVGDLVEGVGIYPDQEYDLSIIDITDQYKACASYLKMLPATLPIILCPGNHDVGRISEPQPGFHDEYSKPVWEIPNVISVSNPSIVNIDANPASGFEGFDVLMYHGYSFFYYAANIPSIRQKGGIKRSDLIMRYLLSRRHLAPSHTSTLYIPDPKRDYLTIDHVPDFFFTGHIHRATVNNYKNVTCINASCWVSQSDEQERRGIEAQPARAFIINMQTREIKVMNFLSKEDQEKESADMMNSEGVRDG